MLYTYKYSKLDLSCFNYLLEGLGICGIGLGVYYAFKKSDKILDLIKKYIPEEPGLQFKEFIERVLSPFKDLISLISNPKKFQGYNQRDILGSYLVDFCYNSNIFILLCFV